MVSERPFPPNPSSSRSIAAPLNSGRTLAAQGMTTSKPFHRGNYTPTVRRDESRVTSRRATAAAFTLIEVIAAMAILAILTVLAVPEYPKWLAKASQAKCMGNMRSLHVGLSNYLNDHDNIWPQGPSPEAGAAWAAFWIDTLEKVDVAERTWECPAIRRMIGNASRDKITADSIHYSPTMFDALPGTARRWPTQPWLVERADAHGNGALLCFTDGSIKPFNKFLAEQGYR